MSQRKAKEYRQAMEQYRGVVEDVDDLKRRIGAMKARHRREDQLEISRRQARREAEKQEANRAEYREHMRKINAEKRRRKIARQRIAFLACMAILALALVCALVTACSARGNGPAEEREINSAATVSPPVTLVSAEPDMWDGEGEDPLEAEKILLECEFDNLDSLVGLHTFDDVYLFGYAIKLKLLERQSCFVQSKGQKEFKRLFDQVQQRVYSL